jgi:hypothetical protein
MAVQAAARKVVRGGEDMAVEVQAGGVYFVMPAAVVVDTAQAVQV